jgi:lipoprotein-anchoring transpeptidase ErfK/SrfK
MLAAAGTLVAVPQADAAALFYWQDSDPSYEQPAPAAQPRKPKARRPAAKTAGAPKETNTKPQGPLIIAVSIEQQKVRVYDANGLFAESPVSTGMKGHSTPMGVFSVIQKNKMHRSNIYSGAPMPYMQRITWSGIALHAGVLPGYPASHGCIRMPMPFAVKMWNWTRMGARVVITPGAITPATFSHPLLVAQKVVPQPLIASDPATDAPAVKSDKGADAGDATKPASASLANSNASLDLRPTVGHAPKLRERTHTADAGSATNAVVTMSDATPLAAGVQRGGDTSKADATQSGPPVETGTVATDDKNIEETAAVAPSGEPKAETSAEAKSNAVNAEAPTAAITKVEEAKSPESKPAESKAAEKPAEPVKAIVDTPAAAAPDVKKDTARLPGADKAAKTEPPRRPGQIAVFVSRKDSKLYVRESFKPQFDVPITIAPGDRPLGTHVFTAEADKKDPNLLRWSVVSLPVTARNAARTDEEDRQARRRKVAGGAPTAAKPLPAPSSPTEALDRITIAPETMARIAEVLTTGSSIVVSDHGISQGGETGEGTDFIVPLR